MIVSRIIDKLKLKKYFIIDKYSEGYSIKDISEMLKVGHSYSQIKNYIFSKCKTRPKELAKKMQARDWNGV